MTRKRVDTVLRFQVLGPVLAYGEEGPVPLGPARQRTVLAALLIEPGTTVSSGQLIDRVWGDSPPRSPRETLHTYLSRLRTVFAGARGPALVRRSHGYVLDVEPATVDLHEFRATVQRARRATDDIRGATIWRDALALWRDAPLADLDGNWVSATAAVLEAERLVAVADCNDVLLRCGEHAQLLPELTAYAAAHPLDERLAGQLILALYRSGRQADALAHYRALVRRLVEELGSHPTPPLQRLHEQILRQDPQLAATAGRPAGVGNEQLSAVGPPDRVDGPGQKAVAADPPPLTPSQLPPVPGTFLGRERELAALEQAATSAVSAGLVVVTGMAGIGKTSLAVRYARQTVDRFADGQLYLDLRGHSSEPALRPLEALEHLLRGLGTQGRMPTTVAEATARYRSLAAGRKLLVLLDNAASAAQVRPLLAGAPDCLTVVTSRHRLSGLVAREGAHRIALAALPVDDARTLLTRLLGAPRVDAEPEQASALIEGCAGLPLALRIAAAQLADQSSRSLQDYLTEFRERGLAAFALADDLYAAVGSAFDLSYQRLDAAGRRLFRLLGLLPGRDVTADAAAAMLGTTSPEARELFRSLVSVHLLAEDAPGRYRLHDLLRVYARHCVETEEPADVRTAVLDRLCTWYYQGKRAAAARLVPWRLEPPCPPLSDDIPERSFASEREATDWLEDEFDNIVAAVRVAADSGLAQWTWLLALGAVADMQRRGRRAEVLAIVQIAVTAARTSGDPVAVAVATAELCLVRTSSGLPVTDELIREMLAHAAATGDRSVHGNCCYVAGVSWERRGDLDRAAEYLQRAHALQGDGESTGRQAMTLLHFGNVSYRQGDLRRSAAALGQLRDIADGLPPAAAAPALVNLSHVLLALGRLDQVPQLLDRAAELLDRLDDPSKSCVLAYTRGGWYRDTGRYGDASQQLVSATILADQVESPRLRSHTRSELGLCRLARGDVAVARAEFVRAAADAGSPDLRQYRSHAMCGLALCDLADDVLETARDHARVAIELARGTERQYEAAALVTLARVELARGRPYDAITHGEQALGMQRETGHFLGQARAHHVLGVAYHAAKGATTTRQSRHHLQEAHRMFQAYGSPAAREVEQLLTTPT